jgi:DNA polymerase III epsilon subunit-like protein
MIKSLIHLNGNILCAVDVETTGFVPGYNDIWQIAVLPLDNNIKPAKGILPFYLDMKIKRPDNVEPAAIKLNRTDFWQRQVRAVDPWTAADMFDEWFVKLGLPMRKSICPLASNWPFDRSFIVDWLGHETFNQLFSPWYRDTMVCALHHNDIADHRGNRIEYPKVGLGTLCGRLKVKNQKAHDALQDCIATAEVYRRLISQSV